MKTLFTVIGISLLLGVMVSCGKVNKVGADGYYFEKETFTHTDLQVHIHLVNSQQEMNDLISKRESKVHGTLSSSREVVAFSVIREQDSVCDIYMVDPKLTYEPEFYGHELVHCLYGVWHQEPQT